MNITTQLNTSKIHLLKAATFFAFTFLLSATSTAQPNKKSDRKAQHEKVEKMKISFITKELDLTTEESEKFWPIYNEMSKKIRTEKKLQRSTGKELKKNHETLTDSDFKTKTDLIFDSEAKEASIKKEYTGKIAGVIGYKKAAKILSLEQRFKRELLNKVNRSERPERPE
ncbi:MAG TPA: hypothetical protein EYG86_01020 [Crocinitomicaceae bacterium]|nr:hypothetical protein [Crocinitomicaceae bacterium]